MTDSIRARLDEIEAGFGYYHRLPLLAALRAVLKVCNELDDEARLTDASLSYDEGWVDGVYEVTTAIEAGIATALEVTP